MINSFFKSFISSIGRTLGKIITYILIALILLMLFGNGVKAETVDFPPKFLDHTLDQEWLVPAGGSITGQINFLSSQPLDTSFAFVDICTTGYEPTLWITSMTFGEIAASTSWYQLDIPCNTGGYKANVYRQIMYIPSSVSANDSTYGTLYNVAATGRLFNNTKEYATSMRLLHIGLSENIPLDDIILQNDMTQTELLRDILDSLSNNDSTMQGVLESNQAIKEQTEELNNSITSESEDFEDNSCGIICKLGKIPGKIIDGLIEGIKSLFIPEDGYFENWFNNLKTFFEEKLGFLAAPFTIFIDFVNMYLNLDADTDIIINIPDIYVPNFEEYKIISATSFNWSELLKSKESLNALWQLYLAFVDVFLILNFINLCEGKYNAIFGGNTSNYEYYTVEDSITYDNDTGEVTGRRMNERRTTRKKV